MPIHRRAPLNPVVGRLSLPLVYADPTVPKPTGYWAIREAGASLTQAAKYDRMLRELTSGLKKRLAEGRN